MPKTIQLTLILVAIMIGFLSVGNAGYQTAMTVGCKKVHKPVCVEKVPDETAGIRG